MKNYIAEFMKDNDIEIDEEFHVLYGIGTKSSYVYRIEDDYNLTILINNILWRQTDNDYILDLLSGKNKVQKINKVQEFMKQNNLAINEQFKYHDVSDSYSFYYFDSNYKLQIFEKHTTREFLDEITNKLLNGRIKVVKINPIEQLMKKANVEINERFYILMGNGIKTSSQYYFDSNLKIKRSDDEDDISTSYIRDLLSGKDTIVKLTQEEKIQQLLKDNNIEIRERFKILFSEYNDESLSLYYFNDELTLMQTDHIADSVFLEALLNKEDKIIKQIPPVGVLPKYLHRKNRIAEINSAIRTYNELGKQIPVEWIDELASLSIEYIRDNQKNIQERLDVLLFDFLT